MLVVVKLVDGEPTVSILFEYHGKTRTFRRAKDEAVGRALDRIANTIGKQNTSIASAAIAKGMKPPDYRTPSVSLFHNNRHTEKINNEMKNEHAWKTGCRLKIDDVDFEVVVNPPKVTRLELPHCIMAGYYVVPLIELEFASVSYSRIVWSVGNQIETTDGTLVSEEWECVGDGPVFAPDTKWIGRSLKVTLYPGNEQEQSQVGLPLEVISDSRIGCGPGMCPFESRQSLAGAISEHDTLVRVISYNILADCYASSDFAKQKLFPYCPEYAIDIQYRRQVLLKEILGYQAHIVCLQECDSKQFSRYFEPAMKTFNYAGLFCNKSGSTREGEAIFYDQKRFSPLVTNTIPCNKFLDAEENAELLAYIRHSPEFLQQFSAKSSIGQVVFLLDTTATDSDASRPKVLCILNTHLYYKSDAGHVRILQLLILLRSLAKLIQEFLDTPQWSTCDLGVLLCGDLNSMPDTGLIELVTSGILRENHDIWELFRTCIDRTAHIAIKHPFTFTNFCGYPEFTNFAGGFSGTLDYIFGNDCLTAHAVVPFNDKSDFEQYIALPSVVAPSDHVPLICDVAWRSKSDN